MAAIVKTTFQLNGSFKFIAVVQITGDAAGDISQVDAVQVSALTAGIGGVPTEFKIDSVDWEFTGFTGSLNWHGDVDTLALALPQYDGSIQFTQPLNNDAGAGKDGDLHLTTNGLGAGMTGTIIIKGRHK